MKVIKLNELKTRKQVTIDNDLYTVRRFGNMEELEYRSYLRELQKLALLEKDNPLNEEQLDRIDEINKILFDMIVSLFDDGENFTKSRKLLASLSDTEISLLIERALADEPEK